MATTKTRFVFHAEDALAARIKGIAAESGAPVAEVIRRALRHNAFMDTLTPDQRKVVVTRQPVLFAPNQETR